MRFLLSQFKNLWDLTKKVFLDFIFTKNLKELPQMLEIVEESQ